MRLIETIYLFCLLVLFTGCKDQQSGSAEELFDEGNYEQAVEAYTKSLEIDPRNVKILYNRGRAYEEMGDFEKAEIDFLSVLEVDEKNINSYLSLSKIYYEMGRYSQSLLQSEKALEINENSAKGHFLSARAKHHMGYMSQALESYNMAISLDRNYGEAYLYRGGIKISQNDNRSGCADIVKAESLNVPEAKAARLKYCN